MASRRHRAFPTWWCGEISHDDLETMESSALPAAPASGLLARRESARAASFTERDSGAALAGGGRICFAADCLAGRARAGGLLDCAAAGCAAHVQRHVLRR